MTNKLLLIVDMQNDFITGSLGTADAVAIVDNATKLIQNFEGTVIYTRDTHGPEYLTTQEGAFLPVEHCIKGTHGWELADPIQALVGTSTIIDKPTFGSNELVDTILAAHKEKPFTEITLAGLCTDICVVTNALLLKTALPEIAVRVEAQACAGVTPEKHAAALETMRSCQVTILNA